MVRRMQLHPLVAGFDGIAEEYELGRPGYPPDVAQAIADAAGGPRLLDVGAGTGKLAGPLLALGRDVVAVEPLGTMRAVLARSLGAGRVLAGTAEAIPLPDASVDGAVSSDAWHWFDGARAAAELHRVVRPGGGVVICELVGVGQPDAPYARALREVLEPLRAGADHPLAQGCKPDLGRLDWTPPGFERDGFAPLERRDDLRLMQHTDRARLLAHARSISFVNALAPARRAAVLAELDARLRAAGVDSVDVPYGVTLWITRRLP
jgi:SAM-dependent methyltransferase